MSAGRVPFLLRRMAPCWLLLSSTALVATHDTALLGLADSVLRLEDGRLTAAGAAALR